jgi:hypothetical protein
VSTKDQANKSPINKVFFAGTTLDGQIFGSTSAYTSTKVMVAKMSVDMAGTSYIYAWAKAYCIECALGNPNWLGTVNVKDIFYSSSGYYVFVAVQADTATMVL